MFVMNVIIFTMVIITIFTPACKLDGLVLRTIENHA